MNGGWSYLGLFPIPGREKYLVKLRLKPMKIEWKAFHRRAAEHAEMIHLFSLPLTPQDRLRYLRDGGRRQRKMLMPSGQVTYLVSERKPSFCHYER